MEGTEPMNTQVERLRAMLLADRSSRVHRELWRCNGGTYLAYRSYLSHQRLGAPASRSNQEQAEGATVSRPSPAAAYQAPKYMFDGVSFICDESHAAVSVLSFAKVRSDLLAFANQEGDIWLLYLPSLDHKGQGQQQQETAAAAPFCWAAGAREPVVKKLPKVHAKTVSGMDWSFDNSQLLTVGLDGAICLWDSQQAVCIRSIALRVPLHCCRFHTLNPNFALVGSATGFLEVYNCSAGTLHSKYQVSSAFQWDLHVTAVELSNHHVFVGDSHGFIHLYRLEMHNGQLKQLLWQMKLQACARLHKAPPAIIQLEFVPFCRATDTPMVLSTCRDGTLTFLRVHEKHHRIDRHAWCATAVMARDIRAALCPLSAIQDVPRIAMGAEDTNVYMLNITGGSHKPVVLNTLKGHRAPVVGTSFAFDESLLASGDSDGVVTVWRRSTA